jgi:hypothetical protein
VYDCIIYMKRIMILIYYSRTVFPGASRGRAEIPSPAYYIS